MALAVNEVYQVRFVAQMGNQVSINVRHYVCTAISGASRTAQQMATGMDASVNGLYKAVMAPVATWRGIGVKRLTPTPEIEFTSVASAGPGILAGDALPPQTAGIVGLQTIIPGPRGHGRAYIPFPTEQVNDANGLTTAGYQGLIAAIGAWLAGSFTSTAGADSATLWPIIWHRDLGTYDKLILGAYYVRSRWATQRRRSGFGAANQLPF